VTVTTIKSLSRDGQVSCLMKMIKAHDWHTVVHFDRGTGKAHVTLRGGRYVLIHEEGTVCAREL
jgi:hypothetical protein